MICSECGKEIDDEYYMVGDNYLQYHYFDEMDGSDNVFCSEKCLCDSLSVLRVFLQE